MEYSPLVSASGVQCNSRRFYKKGRVKKKVLPRPEGEDFCLDVQPTVGKCPRFRWGFALVCLPSSGVHLSVVTAPIESGNWASATGLLECQPWFYRRLVAYRYLWLSRRHNVKWVTRCRSTQGRSHGLILHLDRASREPDRPPSEGNHRRWKGQLPETLKRLADAIVGRRNSLLSSVVSVIAAIFRARWDGPSSAAFLFQPEPHRNQRSSPGECSPRAAPLNRFFRS